MNPHEAPDFPLVSDLFNVSNPKAEQAISIQRSSKNQRMIEDTSVLAPSRTWGGAES